MKQNRIRELCAHATPSPDGRTAAQRMGDLYAGIVRNRLDAAGCSPRQQLEAIETLLRRLDEPEQEQKKKRGTG